MPYRDIQHDKREDILRANDPAQTRDRFQSRDQEYGYGREPSKEAVRTPLEAQVQQRQEEATQRQNETREHLQTRHEHKQQELHERFQEGFEHLTDNATARQVEQDRQRDLLNTVEQFQKNQQEQLHALDRNEDGILERQATLAADMEERQRTAREHLEQDGEQEELSPEILQDRQQRLAAEQEQERARLEEYFQQQAQALKQFHETTQQQMHQDQRELQQALYGSDRQVNPQQVLDKQLERLESQRAYNGRFVETPALQKIWEKAAENKPNTPKGFEQARQEFWTRVNNDVDEDARKVQKILDDAGYKREKGSNAPILDMQYQDAEDRKARERMHLRLTIDHAEAKSRTPEKTLEPDNLRFMLQYDNSVRGNNHDALDQKLQKNRTEEQSRRQQREGRQRQERADKLVSQEMYRPLQERLSKEATEAERRYYEEVAQFQERQVAKAQELEEILARRQEERQDLANDVSQLENAASAHEQQMRSILKEFQSTQSEQIDALRQTGERLRAGQREEVTEAQRRQREKQTAQTLREQLGERQQMEERFRQENEQLEKLRQKVLQQRQEDECQLQAALYDHANREDTARQEHALRTIQERQQEAQERLKQEAKELLARLEEERRREQH